MKNALRWLTNSFYMTGASYLHGVAGVDQAIADKVQARLEGGDDLTFRWPNGREEHHHVYVGMRNRTTKFVTKFNGRVREAQGG